MKKRKAVFTELVITEAGASAIQDAVRNATGGALLPRLWCHHLTLVYKPQPDQVTALPIGETVTLTVTGFSADDRAQAVLCVVPDGLVCSNTNPHITVATGVNETGKHFSPVVSNDVLAEVGVTMFENPLTIETRVGFFNGREDRFDFEGSIY
tara:strand:- start:69 stop:527 length:459 start_codon:yes stop_codon:yes gene_type:complete